MLDRQEKQRKPSRFFAQELLYDYKCQRLDGERKKIVESLLKADKTLAEELAWLDAAEEYCEELSRTKVSEDFNFILMQARLPHERRVDRFKFKNWPESLKWGVEAFALSVAVMFAAVLLPWQELSGLRDKILPAENLPKASKLKELSEPAQSETKKIETTQPEIDKRAPIAAVESNKKENSASGAKKVEEKTKGTSLIAPKASGIVYQLVMKVPEISDKASALKKALEQIGAVKAGKVELGWRKSDGNYFHFSMPQSNYDKLIKTLDGYGPVRIYKNPHPRVMPAGVIRIILWIEDGEVTEAVAKPENTDANTTIGQPGTPPESAPEGDQPEAP